MKTLLLLAFLLLPIQPLTQKEAAQAAAPRLDDLAWLAGSWGERHAALEREEVWLAPKGGLMLGLHRDTPAHGKASFEYLRIEERARGIVYLASPQGRPATSFGLVECSAASATFENLEHDFPQRIHYRLEGEELHVRAAGGGRDLQWVWKREP